jgi:biopolymer transport protein TolR
MGMAVGGGRRGGPSSEINMTPMIDVLLVLLIIFMVIQPAMQKGIEVQVPPVEERQQPQSEPNPDQIVLEIQPGPNYSLNGIPVAPQRLEGQLRSIFNERARKVLFVKGDESLRYHEVIRAIDAARAANVEVVGLVPRSRTAAVAAAGAGE